MASFLIRIAAVAMLAGLAACGPTEKAETANAPFMPKSLTPEAVKAADEFLWLEDINGEKAMEWVTAENEKTKAILEADPRYPVFQQEALAILTAQDRTPTPVFRAGGIHNFWQDQTNVHGVWRRTTLASYRSDNPKWETVLDLDALSKTENANWIWKGTDCLEPAETRCLVNLSDGGKDAVVVREFDTNRRAFIEGGFNIPEGKHRISWLDQDTLLVATDFGAGSLTESGYPFIVKTLKRGQTLDQATELYRGDAGDGGYGVSPAVMRDGSGKVLAVIVSRPLDTFRSETWEIVDGKPVKLNLPERATVQGAFARYSDPKLVFTVEEAWSLDGRDVGPGALMSVSTRLLRPRAEGQVVVANADYSVFEPKERQSIEEVAVMDDRIVATIYDNVKGRAVIFGDNGENGWPEAALASPENVAIHLGSTSRSSGRIFYTYEGFLTPSTLSLADVR
ncbi:MAG TPA: S9 family peptidase, partial [Hyphomonadaceae bacterium]|nr:S9 family peptidase [Hyphomonadaceae bacterium]